MHESPGSNGALLTADGVMPSIASIPNLPGGPAPLGLSVVVPLKNEEATVVKLFHAVRKVCEREGVTFEVVFVDDGSTDSSAAVIIDLAGKDDRAQLVRLRRNFGKAAALAAGFGLARGMAVITMDADLQDDPEEIPALLALLQEYDVVSGWKKERHDPLSRRLASKVFNAVTRRATGLDLHDFNCGLKAYRAGAAHYLAERSYGELHRYLPALAQAGGYTVTEKVVNHRPRASGRSRYGLERYVRGSLDLVTVVFLTRYQRRPMHAFGGVALATGAGAGGMAVVSLATRALGRSRRTGGVPVPAVVLGVGAVQMLLVGAIAEALAARNGSAVPVAGLTPVLERRAGAAGVAAGPPSGSASPPAGGIA